MKDQEFVEYVVKALVDNSEKVTVERRVDEMGKVIGRDGATAKALRTLLRVVGMKNNARVNLKINEPEGRVSSNESTLQMAQFDTGDVDAVMDDLKNI